MSGYRKCAVSGCENKTAPRHRFPNPTKNLDRFQVWLKACASETLCSLDPDLVYRSHRVCNIHFSKEDACRNNYLSRLAVPKLFVCSSEDSFTCDLLASTNIALERVRSSHLYVPEAKRTRLEMIVDKGSVPSCSVPADPDNRKSPSPSAFYTRNMFSDNELSEWHLFTTLKEFSDSVPRKLKYVTPELIASLSTIYTFIKNNFSSNMHVRFVYFIIQTYILNNLKINFAECSHFEELKKKNMIVNSLKLCCYNYCNGINKVIVGKESRGHTSNTLYTQAKKLNKGKK